MKNKSEVEKMLKAVEAEIAVLHKAKDQNNIWATGISFKNGSKRALEWVLEIASQMPEDLV